MEVCPDIALQRTARAAGRGGAELTFGGKMWSGFPSGPYGRELSFAELRAGPWAQAIVRAHGVVYEIGPKVHLGATYHASWGHSICAPRSAPEISRPAALR